MITLSEIFAFLAILFPLASFAPAVNAEKAETPPPIPRIIQTQTMQRLREDYADGPRMDGLYRWRRFPIRIYFDESGLYSAERRERAIAGFDEWADATKGAISYVITDSAREANIQVSFLPVRSIGKDRRTIGQTGTLMRRGSGYLFRAKIEIAAQGMDSEFLTEVIAHEFGHALGINGHSDDENDLMFPSAKRYHFPFGNADEKPKGPTARDLNTLRRAYPDL